MSEICHCNEERGGGGGDGRPNLLAKNLLPSLQREQFFKFYLHLRE